MKVDNPNNQRNKQSKRVGCPYSVTIWKINNRPGDHTYMAARTDNSDNNLGSEREEEKGANPVNS